jgi:hypothetical protein
MTKRLDSRRVINLLVGGNDKTATALIKTALKFDDNDTKTDLDYLLQSCFVESYHGRFNIDRTVKMDFKTLRILCECGINLNSLQTRKTILQRLINFCIWDDTPLPWEKNDDKTMGDLAKKAINMILYFGADPLCNMIRSVDATHNEEISKRHCFLFGLRVLDKKYTINDLLPKFQVHCFHSKIKLILLSFREGVCWFGLLAPDTIKEILVLLGLSTRISNSLVELIKQMDAKKNKPLISRKRKPEQ